MSGRFPLSGARFITLIPCLPALTYVQTNHRSNAPFTPRVLLCGPAGSGKSLQAALLAQKYSLLNGECLPCPAPAPRPSGRQGWPGGGQCCFSCLISALNHLQCVHLCKADVFSPLRIMPSRH